MPVDVRDAPRNCPFWVIGFDLDMFRYTSPIHLQSVSMHLENYNELDQAEYGFRCSRPTAINGDIPFPPDFPKPVLNLPTFDLAPDFFDLEGGKYFVSRRLRDALDQPPSVVQYWPVEVTSGSAESRAQDHMLAHFVACEAALDPVASGARMETFFYEGMREPIVTAGGYQRFTLKRNFSTTHDIFHEHLRPSLLLIRESVAARVQEAGCTGIAFKDPASMGDAAIYTRYRTVDGVRLEWTGRELSR
jgi:hypothetical protein